MVKTGNIMSRKIVIILAALCIIFIVSTASSIFYYNSILNGKNQQISSLQKEVEEVAPLNAQIDSLNATIQQQNSQIVQKNEALDTLNNKIIELNSQITDLNSQINSLNSQVGNQSNLVIDSINVTDERFGTIYYLHIACRINNTGTATAYNALLHVMAFNAEGTAIDDYHSFGGLTGGMSIRLDFVVNYTGSPINSWIVSPIWTSQLSTPSTGTLP
jgi:septal ring factor EnvC (AmiA/AmiB activator)